MPPRKSETAKLRGRLAVEEGKLERQTATRLAALEKTITRQQRALTSLKKRTDKLEAQNTGLRKQVRNLRKRKAGRQRQSHVDHRLSKAEKVHLLRAWMNNKNHPETLEREGRKLAKRYKLDYKRQVQVWFRNFRRMTSGERRKLSRQGK